MPIFQFQRFSLNDDGAAMKVGTDGILLGSWSRCDSAQRILDVGTGCGLIALMLAQRTQNSNSQITGVELDPRAALQAGENFQSSPWSDRLSITSNSVQEFALQTPTPKFDLIVCNPPFFEFKGEDQARDHSSKPRVVARQTLKLTISDLLSCAVKLLAPNGLFSLVFPYDQQKELLQIAFANGFSLSRQTNVRPLPGQPFKRSLLEFNLNGQSATETLELTLETTHHHYSNEFESLTGDFYLRFK